jgi:hypothetical protein
MKHARKPAAAAVLAAVEAEVLAAAAAVEVLAVAVVAVVEAAIAAAVVAADADTKILQTQKDAGPQPASYLFFAALLIYTNSTTGLCGIIPAW